MWPIETQWMIRFWNTELKLITIHSVSVWVSVTHPTVQNQLSFFLSRVDGCSVECVVGSIENKNLLSSSWSWAVFGKTGPWPNFLHNCLGGRGKLSKFVSNKHCDISFLINFDRLYWIKTNSLTSTCHYFSFNYSCYSKLKSFYRMRRNRAVG